MASKSQSSSAKKKEAAIESSMSIEEQTRAFLESGGKVEKIQTGVSGQQNFSGPKHIVIGNK